jgi:hypothetical protein
MTSMTFISDGPKSIWARWLRRPAAFGSGAGAAPVRGDCADQQRGASPGQTRARSRTARSSPGEVCRAQPRRQAPAFAQHASRHHEAHLSRSSASLFLDARATMPVRTVPSASCCTLPSRRRSPPHRSRAVPRRHPSPKAPVSFSAPRFGESPAIIRERPVHPLRLLSAGSRRLCRARKDRW